MELITASLAAVIQPDIMLLLAGSVILGTIGGAIPGISATMTIALVSPLTFSMDPFSGIITLVGFYVGSVYGGSISAILLGIPGTPGAVVTCLDGHVMARRGQAGKALGVATISSFIGGSISAIALMLLSYPLAGFALSFGPREYLALAIFALTAMASLSGGSFLKGITAGLLGLFLASIGIDETYGVSRFHFDQSYLMGGFSFIPVIIGMFALPEALLCIERLGRTANPIGKVTKIIPSKATLKSILPAQLRCGVIGTIVGAVPGAGSDIAAIVGYSQGKNLSKHPERFGTGCSEGIACPESANNGATGGSLIPLLTLGIPGGAVTAIMLGTFMTHGLQPGPLLLANNADLVYKIFSGAVVANIILLCFGLIGAKYFSKILRVPESLLVPVIIILCIVGSYSIRNSTADIAIMVAIGLLGYLMIKINVPRAPLVIGLILGPMVEGELNRSLIIIGDDWMNMFTPVSTIIWSLAIAPFFFPWISKWVSRIWTSFFPTVQNNER